MELEARKDFFTTFRSLAPHKHRYDVFKDFVTMTACSLHNAICPNQAREDEYLAIINAYNKEDRMAFPKLMAKLVEILEPEPRDILGPLYMELEISSKDQGQFFTPPELSDLMAQMTVAVKPSDFETGFINLSEPACGAGGMVLSVVKMMTRNRIIPSDNLWVQAIDIDRLAALMCFVQLSLWHVPAQIIVGDTLRWQHREVWHTPAHYMGFWNAKLARRANEQALQTVACAQVSKPLSKPVPEVKSVDTGDGSPIQLGFDF